MPKNEILELCFQDYSNFSSLLSIIARPEIKFYKHKIFNSVTSINHYNNNNIKKFNKRASLIQTDL